MHILILTLLLVPTVLAADADFAAFLKGLRQDAIKAGIKSAPIDSALSNLEINPKILHLYNRQPESAQTLKDYLRRRVSQQRIERGRQLMTEHRSLLEAVELRFGVQPRFIVSLWGNESDFGANMGGFSVIRSLATLAYGSKRKDYFRRELMVALRILDQGDIDPTKMVGSWAGAMGQCQFMPWSYQRRAVDFDGDGRRDIWHSKPDVFASIAHYLSDVGWRDDLTWGRAVNFKNKIILDYINQTKTLADWQALGLRRLNGSALPARDISAKLIRPARGQGQLYLVYANYEALLKWNRSHSFAIAIGTLADQLR